MTSAHCIAYYGILFYSAIITFLVLVMHGAQLQCLDIYAHVATVKLELCNLFCGRKTIGELCEDMEVVRSADSTFGNLEMTFKLNKASALFL